MSVTTYQKWVQLPIGEQHFYKITQTGILHVNATRLIVNALPPSTVPGLAQECDPEEFTQAIHHVWEQFNAIQ